MKLAEILQLSDSDRRKHCPIPEPPRPGGDWRWWSLWIPPICSAIGFFLFGIFGYGFSQIKALPTNLIGGIVIVGAVFMAAGAELGTVSATWEVLRRHYNGEGVTKLDWCGLMLSMCTSVTTLILSWAWLQAVDTTWSEWMRLYGPLCVGALTICDFTVSCVEAGTYLGTYDRRRRGWEESEYKPWLRKLGRSLDVVVEDAHPEPVLAPVKAKPDMNDTQELEPVPRPVEKKPAKKRGRPKKQAHKKVTSYEGITEVEGGWDVVCAVCGWTGKSPYGTEKKAKQALGGHKHFCPTTVKINGDF